ncbi:MAG TPA: ATP-binding protein [Acidimicrobiales bacterium]|nr:ATP-binding protein [Acidimicrobiales bacterium]
MSEAQPPVDLEVPARPEYVRLVRLVVGSLAASRRDLDDDRVEDLRLAVNEACTLAVGETTDGRLRVVCSEEPDAFVVDVFEGPEDSEGDEGDEGLAFALMRALVDEVRTVEEDGVRRLQLRVLCAPAPSWG